MTIAPAWSLRHATALSSCSDNEAKETFLKKIIKESLDSEDLYRNYGIACKTRSSGLVQDGFLQWRMWTCLSVLHGAGDRHLLDVPMVFTHPVWGVPVIHGESIKGACRASAIDALDGVDGAGGLLDMQFGTIDQLGQLEFEDAWWTPSHVLEKAERHFEPGPLVLERIAPSDLEYHESLGEQPPRLVRRDQKIVPQLAAQGTFTFWCRPPGGVAASAAWRAAVTNLVQRTLQYRGVGSGTNTDRYGRFARVGDAAAPGHSSSA